MTASYPSSASERTRWIVERRGGRNQINPQRPYAFFIERERMADGTVANVATIFLTNRECPWHCVMCDLWRNTTEQSVAIGGIPKQIEFALSQLGPAGALKLYNSGSFFDPGAIPQADWPGIAKLCRGFKHLIVESHPRLIGPAVLKFHSMLSCSLEIAVGLETAHPEALEAINKRISVRDFKRAAEFLERNKIALRTFLLVNPPFIPVQNQNEWLQRSIEFAFESGSRVVSLIPLRAGNGAVEELMREGVAAEPDLNQIESAQESGLACRCGRVFADTWDLKRFSRCANCFEKRRERLERMNLSQQIEPRIVCCSCGSR